MLFFNLVALKPKHHSVRRSLKEVFFMLICLTFMCELADFRPREEEIWSCLRCLMKRV